MTPTLTLNTILTPTLTPTLTITQAAQLAQQIIEEVRQADDAEVAALQVRAAEDAAGAESERAARVADLHRQLENGTGNCGGARERRREATTAGDERVGQRSGEGEWGSYEVGGRVAGCV